MIRHYLSFLLRAALLSFSGSWRFYAWMSLLTLVAGIGGNAYCRQYVAGLGVTGMTDQVSWGLYIANFTFLVGLAAAAIMLVIPAYIYRNKAMHDVVLLGELLAIAALVMVILFITADLGRPDRFWHMIPGIGEFNFPGSILTWDVLVLNGYLLVNLHICGYLLYMKYLKKKPKALFYMPFVLLSIGWAISIHTVTAFLYVSLVGRPFWNSAIIAPRFLGSAITAGPALLILVLQFIRIKYTYKIDDKAIYILRQIATVSLSINLFLLMCETFKEFFSPSAHSSSAQYLFFGLEQHGEHFASLVPWIWGALLLEAIAMVILLVPHTARRIAFLNVACVFAIIGIWIEKGMGLVIPGFIPSPQGRIVEYFPSATEVLVCVGVWSFGLLVFSWMLHLAMPILTGEFAIAETEPEFEGQTDIELVVDPVS